MLFWDRIFLTRAPATQDRMELITVPGYSFAEKAQIARTHLVPKQLKLHGMGPDAVRLQDAALTLLVRSYTRESGVRALDRCVAAVVRWVAAKAVMDEEARGGTRQVVLRCVAVLSHLRANGSCPPAARP